MENDVLKNKIAPWQEKGRWYHAEVSSNETSWTLNDIDVGLNKQIVSGVYLAPFTDNKFSILDIKVRINGDVKVQFTQPTNAISIVHDPVRDILQLPPASRINGIMEIWFFANKK